MTSGSPGSPLSAAKGAASMALLVGLLAAPGCRESALGPDVPEDNVVVADGRHRGDDPYEVNSAAIDGHRLTIEVSYSGGCRRHDFTLVISKSFRESDPVGARSYCESRACPVTISCTSLTDRVGGSPT